VNAPQQYIFEGPIYGTYYKVIVVAKKFSLNKANIQQAIQSKLNDIDAIFSTYSETSKLSQFNHFKSTQPIVVDPLLFDMILKSQVYFKAMNGAWDPSILPLSQRHQFQHGIDSNSVSDLAAIVGFNKFKIVLPNLVQKLTPDARLDFSSFIKGYAVDELIEYLQQQGITGAYVDIGGEIRTTGWKSKKRPWLIGIQSPTNDDAMDVLELNNMAIATSGNYLNYQMIDGQRVGHILDPRTLAPITHQMLSVSIISPKCIDADAFATGLFVMGPAEAEAWFSINKDVMGMMVYLENNDAIARYFNGFEAYLKKH
jgi:thiamine biosynthesis lipoprotein